MTILRWFLALSTCSCTSGIVSSDRNNIAKGYGRKRIYMGEKLWQGRFEQPMNKLVEEFTASIHFDKRLFRYDIEGSIAHCRMLAACKIISDEEASRIVAGLGEIQREIERGEIDFCLRPGRHPHGHRAASDPKDRRSGRQAPYGEEPQRPDLPRYAPLPARYSSAMPHPPPSNCKRSWYRWRNKTWT